MQQNGFSQSPAGLPGVSVFYCDIANAGDQFNVDLFSHYGYRAELAPPETAEVVGVGSILGFLPAHCPAAIMGGGFMAGECGNTLSRGAVHAVRGRLSRKLICRKAPVLGDPGLLAGLIYPRAKTRYALGIVPHYVDLGHPVVEGLASRESGEVQVIDIRQSPAEVISRITECEAIASSSLHGLIFADSFAIPSVWMPLSNKVTGGEFKFLDYFSVFDEVPRPLTAGEAESAALISKRARRCSLDRLEEVKSRLDGVFKRLPEIVAEVRARRGSRLREALAIVRNRIGTVRPEEAALSEAARRASRAALPPMLRWLP
jgi:pyruvyltransferase